MSDLMHLAYISKSTIDGDLETVEAEVRNILTVAQENNARHNITGALLYSGGYFCQVIEGEEEELAELFESIQMDGRHSDVTVLHFESLETRGFPEWAMAYAGVESSRRFSVDGIKESHDDLLIHETGKSVVATLASLAAQHQALISD